VVGLGLRCVLKGREGRRRGCDAPLSVLSEVGPVDVGLCRISEEWELEAQRPVPYVCVCLQRSVRR
jgi:hypothetical protein